MIDIERQTYEQIINKISTSFPDIYTYNEGMPQKAKFPCVTIEQFDNSVYAQTQSSSNLENHAVISFEVNVYSNKANGKKEECKDILKIIDDEFNSLGFSRLSINSFAFNDATVYRIIARYTAIVGADEKIYRRY